MFIAKMCVKCTGLKIGLFSESNQHFRQQFTWLSNVCEWPNKLWFEFYLFHCPLEPCCYSFYDFLFRHREQDSSSQSREIKGLSKQVRSIEDELAAVTRNRDSIIKENKRLQSDLALMTDENQVFISKRRESYKDYDAVKFYSIQFNHIFSLSILLAFI